MSRIWWVRHGPTHQKAFVGWRDVPADLSDTDQINRLADYLPHEAVVVSSDLARASATADAIARNRPRLPENPGLREFDFGAWDGLTFDAVARRDPVLSRRFWEEPGDLAAPDGESWNMVANRVSNTVDTLIATHTGQDIIAVAHIGVIMTQIARTSGMTPYTAMGHTIENLSVTEIGWAGDGWALGRINHLP